MFPSKQEEVMSFDVLTLAKRGWACSMEGKTTAHRIEGGGGFVY